MRIHTMLSIDQNCHSLWDVLPKLCALARAGHAATHTIEDIDAAFTAIGAQPNDPLRLARERFHHSGGADWGAAVFYFEFLGRQPVDVRDWEPLTGTSTKALARQLTTTSEGLYDEFSPSDNWQLIGASYVGDREHHRVIGDLSVAETGPFLREILAKARADLHARFVEPAARARIGDWLDGEGALLDDLLARHVARPLVDLYHDWMQHHLADCPSVKLDTTSRLFALGAQGRVDPILHAFLTDYPAAADLYNQAMAESRTGLRELDTAAGELPLFATLRHAGHLVRTGVSLVNGELQFADRAVALGDGDVWPGEELRAAGVQCLAGKAAVLVNQVRLGPAGRPLALPYQGSLYMPAAHRLVDKLTGAGLLDAGSMKPVIRVRLRLLDRMRDLTTQIRLPDYLAAAMGQDVVGADELAAAAPDLIADARRRLDAFATDQGRQQWQREACGEATDEIRRMDARRRELAQTDPKSAEIRDLSHRIRELEVRVQRATLEQIARDWHVARLDYWDSRGAILPWCVALGGREFYESVLRHAEIYEEGGNDE